MMRYRQVCLVSIFVLCRFACTESRCPDDREICKNTSLDLTNLNITLYWSSWIQAEGYDVLYCNKSDGAGEFGEWVQVPGCSRLVPTTNNQTNHCYLSPLISLQELAHYNTFNIGNGNHSCNVRDFMPLDEATIGAPEILETRVTRTDIFVSISAPESPYKDSTGKPYRLDARQIFYFDVEYLATLRLLNATGTLQIEEIKGPQVVPEFYFGELKPFTQYEVDIMAILDNRYGKEHTFITLQTNHDDPPSIKCPNSIYISVNKGVNGSNVTWQDARAWDKFNNPLTPQCDMTPGSFFELNTTRVTCSVEDDVGNGNYCSFDVKVRDKVLTLIGLIALISGIVILTIAIATTIITAVRYRHAGALFKDADIPAWLNSIRERPRPINHGRLCVTTNSEVFDTPVQQVPQDILEPSYVILTSQNDIVETTFPYGNTNGENGTVRDTVNYEHIDEETVNETTGLISPSGHEGAIQKASSLDMLEVDSRDITDDSSGNIMCVPVPVHNSEEDANSPSDHEEDIREPSYGIMSVLLPNQNDIVETGFTCAKTNGENGIIRETVNYENKSEEIVNEANSPFVHDKGTGQQDTIFSFGKYPDVNTMGVLMKYLENNEQ